MQTRNRGDYTIAGRELVAEGADLHVADCAAISLSLWRAQNAIYHGSGYSKSAGDVRNLHSPLNDARMRFAVPSGIFSIPLILLLRMVVVWPDDALVAAAAAVSLLGPP